MEYTLYWIAGLSTALFGIRLVLMLFGVDGHADAADAVGAVDTLDASHAAGDVADFKVFSLMTLLVTLMLGSWAAIGMLESGLPGWIALLGGYGGGFAGGVGVSYLLFSMKKLEADGTVHIEDAVGLKGTVYAAIPVAGQGRGQIQVTVRGRLRTFDAVSDGPAIPSFTTVVVMSKVEHNLLRVCPTE